MALVVLNKKQNIGKIDEEEALKLLNAVGEKKGEKEIWMLNQTIA